MKSSLTVGVGGVCGVDVLSVEASGCVPVVVTLEIVSQWAALIRSLATADICRI